MSAAFTLASTTKAKSRSTGWNGDSSSTGLARVGFAFGSGIFSRITSNADQRPFGLERFERARMQLAEMAEHVLRPDLDGAAAAGMEPGRPAGHDLQRLHRRAGGRQHGEGVGLGVEGVDRARRLLDQWRPMPLGLGERAAHAGGGGELILRLVALEDLPDLEQRHVGDSRGRHCAAPPSPGPGMRLGRMSDSSAAIGLASASSGLPPPNSSASRFDTNDQVTASTMPRAASARLALRVRFWIGVSTGLRASSPRGNGVEARDRRRRCAPAPRRCRRGHARPAATTGTRDFNLLVSSTSPKILVSSERP